MRLINNNGRTAHVYHSGQYYFISDNGRETLIFPSNAEGKIASFQEVGGGSGLSLLEVLGDFHSFLHNF